MKSRCHILITLLALCCSQTWAQVLAEQLPGQGARAFSSSEQHNATAQPGQAVSGAGLPDAPGFAQVPVAQPVIPPPTGTPVTIHAQEQERQGDIYHLNGEVEIDYTDYIIRADHVTYNAATGEVQAQGNLQLDGGPDNEEITASHGEMNLNTQAGRFYDVIGSVGVRHGTGQHAVYTTPNPFLITGKLLVRNGPESYVLYGGSMTSCRLPKPDWQLLAPRIVVDNGTAKAWDSRFQYMGWSIFYLPYVTHSVDVTGRQSGLLLPYVSNSSIKGKVLGDAYYWAINRSSDLMVGAQYYSLRGWAEEAEYRYRGRGNDFLHGYYNGLFDRGYGPQHINQGGQDTIFMGRRDLTVNTRAVADAEYLSSYVYRLVFAPNFSQAISSEVKSWAFLTHQQNGQAASAVLERYQNFESDTAGDEVRILHLPRLDYGTTDHSFGNSRLFWGAESSFSEMTRSEPGLVENLAAARTDLYPHLSLPLVEDGWTLRPEVGLRDTFYSNSQTLSPTVPIQHNASLDRKAAEAGVQVLPPVLERDYDGDFLAHHFGVAVRHTIAPELQYRYVAGIGNFNNVERFDALDIYSDTNELEYGLTQRWYVKSLRPHPCTADEIANGKQIDKQEDKKGPERKDKLAAQPKSCQGGTQEWLSWFVAQKYFFDPTFGGAVVPGRRNIFTSTVDFSAVAYITAPRNVSPVISRLRAHTSGNTDVEWDLDYDTKAGRIAASNFFTNYRHGNFFSSFGHALMNAPGETIVTPPAPSPVTDYNQVQLLLGYGSSSKSGLSAAASGGYDLHQHSLEYAAVQTSYNSNCCGLSIEYRRYNLGVIRNETEESFSFTLAGVGSAGNLKRAEKLF